MQSDHFLPETATQLAIYLRHLFGDRPFLSARVHEGEIAIGTVRDGIASEDLILTPPPGDGSTGWALTTVVSHPGSYWTLPDSDVVEIATDMPSATVAFAKLAEHIYKDRLALAQQCFDEDQRFLRYGADGEEGSCR